MDVVSVGLASSFSAVNQLSKIVLLLGSRNLFHSVRHCKIRITSRSDVYPVGLGLVRFNVPLDT